MGRSWGSPDKLLSTSGKQQNDQDGHGISFMYAAATGPCPPRPLRVQGGHGPVALCTLDGCGRGFRAIDQEIYERISQLVRHSADHSAKNAKSQRYMGIRLKHFRNQFSIHLLCIHMKGPCASIRRGVCRIRTKREKPPPVGANSGKRSSPVSALT